MNFIICGVHHAWLCSNSCNSSSVLPEGGGLRLPIGVIPVKVKSWRIVPLANTKLVLHVVFLSVMPIDCNHKGQHTPNWLHEWEAKTRSGCTPVLVDKRDGRLPGTWPWLKIRTNGLVQSLHYFIASLAVTILHALNGVALGQKSMVARVDSYCQQYLVVHNQTEDSREQSA